MINFSTVKDITIPEGKVKSITVGGIAIWQKLTAKYKRELAYLESTGTQWIDTGVTVNTETDEVELVFQNMGSVIYKWFFGEHDNAARFGLGTGDGVNKRNVAYGGTTYKVKDEQIYNIQHTFVANENGVFMDDTRIVSFVKFSSTSTLYLFNLNLNSADYCAMAKIWSYKHSRNGVLIRDFIPVLDMNDVPCMYDKVSRKLFYNQGTGEFAYEELPRLPLEYQEVEYIESTGTQYIDTGTKGTHNTSYKLVVQTTKLVAPDTSVIFGSRSSATSNNISSLFGSSAGELYINDFGNYNNTRILVTLSNPLNKVELYNGKNKRYIKDLENGEYNEATTTWTSSFTTPSNLLLGAKSNGFTTAMKNFSGRYYSCEIYESDILVRNFVPCYRKSDGEIGMYDLITNEFFANNGTGTFKKGNDL